MENYEGYRGRRFTSLCKEVIGQEVSDMKKVLWKLLIGIGIIPLVLLFVLGVYHTMIESWTLGDWLILYSYVYWFTYVAGILLIVAGVVVKNKYEKRRI